VLKGSSRIFIPLSERDPYLETRVRLRAGDRPEIPPIVPAARRMDEIRSMVRAGRSVLVDDWEDPHHKERYAKDIEMLGANFSLTPVASHGAFRIYRLSLLH